MTTPLRRWRGLKDLVADAVDKGSSAVQRVHMETARRPFDLLELIPPLATPARAVRVVHDATVSSVYGMIRLVNRAVGGTVGAVLDVMERADASRDADADGGTGPREDG